MALIGYLSNQCSRCFHQGICSVCNIWFVYCLKEKQHLLWNI